LQQERTRLANRIRQQLWRYYPQLLELAEGVTADWLLDVWHLAPTPAAAARFRSAAVTRKLTEHRMRRLTADEVLAILRQPAITVAPGTAKAAVAHIEMLAARVRLVNRQLKETSRQLDELCEQIASPGQEAHPDARPDDAAILRSLPGVG